MMSRYACRFFSLLRFMSRKTDFLPSVNSTFHPVEVATASRNLPLFVP